MFISRSQHQSLYKEQDFVLGPRLSSVYWGRLGGRHKECQSSCKEASVLTAAVSEGALESLWRRGGALKVVQAGGWVGSFFYPSQKGKSGG